MDGNLFKENRLCSLLGISIPIIQAGMVWCSGWELASAVSEAGGLGILGSGSMNADTLRHHIRQVKAHTSKPFAVNTPLLYAHIADQMAVILEEQVPIVFTSAGNPATWTSMLKDRGRKVVHVVSNVKFAEKAWQAGVDAVVAEGFEAGGHNGREELTTLVLIPMVRKAMPLPLIAAGGIATGDAILAAMALGADGVQVGTRFVASVESSAHLAFKQAVVEARAGDTALTLKELTPVRLLKNGFYQQVQEAYAQGASPEILRELLGKGRARKGMFEGDLDAGELEIGQISGLVGDILPAADILAQMVAEYRACWGRLAGSF
jgi:enoyl-[acyl-carrier protein] reductase II